ncbi:DHH family phosphoesterase [Candidatus Pacearchaeota archaeon]|nr:DHH family phosphoesterase [Candidatus Pacearchaeota archaeon]
MTSKFFFSKTLGFYVSLEPLKIDSRVKNAADKAGISLEWDDEGRINYIDFDDSKRLLEELGSFMLTPANYWKVFGDAEVEDNKEMIKSLMSDSFCEWLDRVYGADGYYIDNPKIVSKHSYGGSKIKSNAPFGRPGWLDPKNNINDNEGVPLSVKIKRGKFESSWKYWSPDFSVTKIPFLAPIRGYVTSVGKPSLDLGIPVNARQPVQMIRECRNTLLSSSIPQEVVQEAVKIIYQGFESELFEFIKSHGHYFKDAKESISISLRENLIDVLGMVRIKGCKNENIRRHVTNLVDIDYGKSGFKEFREFVETSRERLNDALKYKKDIVFVMGHKNPDTDTVVSSLFEAWRNNLIKEDSAFIPILQSEKMPDEIHELLGDRLTCNIVNFNDPLYIKAKKSGLARWISVDQNREPEVQRFFISIIDHHVPSEISKKQDIPKTLDVIGSCAAMITRKLAGMGVDFDKDTAFILHGATLMDTENRVSHKMTPQDISIMNFLKSKSGIGDETRFYQGLMSVLLNTDDPDRLFNRDYKEDWGFGFAVAKIKGGFSKGGRVLKNKLLREIADLARRNNLQKNLPLTLTRITDYDQDNSTVNRERVYLSYNSSASKDLRATIRELIIKTIKFEFGSVNFKEGKDWIEFWGTGIQLSRKKTAPILEPVVKAFDSYFYSPSNKLWIKKDFLKKSSDLMKVEKILDHKLSFDEDKRVNWVTYPEAKNIVSMLGFSILSLSEYWKAYDDAVKSKDRDMITNMQGSGFVEFLDSAIIKNKWLVDHPRIENGKLMGKKTKVKVPKDSPGLIHPDNIDRRTGIPGNVRSTNEYGNPRLWRYWAPDADVVIPVRSYIFLLKQPCWDGKFHIDDCFPNLGIRPCTREQIRPIINIRIKGSRLVVSIVQDGDAVEYIWKKGESGQED